jgi:deazaflavin-dependent oxidoreductase (nitroreductase family)
MQTNGTDTPLDKVAAHDLQRRKTPITRLFLAIAGHPWFTAVYKRLGPAVDPFLSRVGGGWITNKVYGMPMCVLVTKGAKSGVNRESPLLYVRDGDEFLVVGTNFGQERHPLWTGNLLASPEAELQIGSTRMRVMASLVEDQSEWSRLFQEFVNVIPAYGTYLERLDGRRTPRMFRLTPVGVA